MALPADEDNLPDGWKSQIRQHYFDFRLKMTKTDEVIKQSFKEGVIDQHTKNSLDKARADSKKIDDLMNDVVLRLNVGSYKKFRQILQSTSNSELADAIPDPENPVLDDNKTAAIPSYDNYQQDTERPGEFAGIQSIPDIPPDKVLHTYPFRRKGLCVIFANFTDDLRGYQTDIQNIDNFFSTLGYDRNIYKNLSYDQMVEKLQYIQGKLRELNPIEDRPVYDRLVVFVLSHGDESGIKFCRDAIGNADSEEPGKRMTLQTIQDRFNGTNAPSLKGLPKFIIFQCCRGDDIVKTASSVDRQGMLREQSHLIPVDSDFLVSYSCTPGNKSVVSESRGSWFIFSMINVFRAYSNALNTTSVEDMLKVVNSSVSKQMGFDADGSNEVLRQMPCYFSTLRMKFCLK